MARKPIFGGRDSGSVHRPLAGHIVPGSEHRDPIISNDLMPTLAEIAGAALPANYPGDGVSLVR